MGDPYREVVEGPVHRLALNARSSMWIRLGFPLIGFVNVGVVALLGVSAQARYAEWSSSTTLTVSALAVVVSLVLGALMGPLLVPSAWKSRSIEIDRDRRVLRYRTPRGFMEQGPKEMVVPFASMRSLYALDGSVYLRTDDGLVHALVDYNHRRTPAEAEGIVERIEELVVTETGAPLPRVRVEAVAASRGPEAETEAEAEAEAEAETETDAETEAAGWSEREPRR